MYAKCVAHKRKFPHCRHLFIPANARTNVCGSINTSWFGKWNSWYSGKVIWKVSLEIEVKYTDKCIWLRKDSFVYKFVHNFWRIWFIAIVPKYFNFVTFKKCITYFYITNFKAFRRRGRRENLRSINDCLLYFSEFRF